MLLLLPNDDPPFLKIKKGKALKPKLTKSFCGHNFPFINTSCVHGGCFS